MESRDLVKLKKWAHQNPMMFNKPKCKVLHLDQGNLKHENRLGEEVTENSLEKGLGVFLVRGWT